MRDRLSRGHYLFIYFLPPTLVRVSPPRVACSTRLHFPSRLQKAAKSPPPAMYQSANYRRAQPAHDAPSDRYRAQATQLQELFPAWSNEVRPRRGPGNVELAAARISEGHAEQWGSVTRKKDKKPGPPHTQSKDASAPRERGDSRGGRGGRGARGSQRPPGKPSQSGNAAAPKHAEEPVAASAGWPDTPVNGAETFTEDTSEVPPAQTNGTTEQFTETPVAPQSGWGSSTPSTWGGTNGWASPAAPVQRVATPKVAKTPATSKMSWAQIARAQEKPAPTSAAPAPVAPPQSISAPAPPPPAVEPLREPTPPHVELPAEPQQQGWEEPTTVQAPTWDDEPRVKPVAESWGKDPTPVLEEPQIVEPEPESTAAPPAVFEREPATVSFEAQLAPAAAEPVAIPTKPLTPAAHTRPGAAVHRGSAKFKTTDQAVVMPSSSFGTGIEKVGMQFGSLSLGGDDIDAPDGTEPPATEPSQYPPRLLHLLGHLSPPSQAYRASDRTCAGATARTSGSSSHISPYSRTSAASQTLFQQTLPPQTQTQPQVVSPPQHTLPSSLSQSAIPTQQPSIPSATPASASMSQFSQHAQSLPQQSLSNHQLPQSQSQNQLHSQQHHQYSQHGLPTHLDPAQSQAQHSPSVPHANQPQGISAAPSYFRQPRPPWPAAPGQGSHLGGFSGNEYGYNDNQRQQGFYDSYSAQSGFGNRNVLGSHDEIKGLPGSSNSLTALLVSRPSTPSRLSRSRLRRRERPRVKPNQYYGSPYNSGYTVPQPFVKYPTVFQGPPGPQSPPRRDEAASERCPAAVAIWPELHSHGQSVGSGLPTNDYGKHQSLYGAGQGMQGFMGLGQSTGPSSGPPLGQRAGASPDNAYKPYGNNAGMKDVGAGVGVGMGQGGVGQGPGRGGVQQPSQGGFYGAQRFGASASGVPQRGSDASFYSYQPRQQQGYWQ
ncbi:uncharacterized protein B0H18DRAFT_1121523 [Fomitopsis serialis]|uniref:uncharacterized protein n=1 Tax=Fomitopsis serialis TaxID=139415 RepID=UPI00200741C4|nr:uncharacterized protein B0H18DRAFT_1121523 [Neoantrodia serialis]KAH9921107.1 hypothetical protein B0H18DRAFT_1121523 [Neoantrodia serialis]